MLPAFRRPDPGRDRSCEEHHVKRSILFVCLILGFGQMAGAATGFQLGLPSLNVPKDPRVEGMRLSFLWGKNSSTNGLDVGVLSMSETSTFSGLALVGGVSKVTGRMMPINCLMNIVKRLDRWMPVFQVSTLIL